MVCCKGQATVSIFAPHLGILLRLYELQSLKKGYKYASILCILLSLTNEPIFSINKRVLFKGERDVTWRSADGAEVVAQVNEAEAILQKGQLT